MPDNVDELWGAIEIVDSVPCDCVVKGPPALARWRYVMPMLEPGTYELQSRMWMDHTLIDRCDWPRLKAPPDCYAFVGPSEQAIEA